MKAEGSASSMWIARGFLAAAVAYVVAAVVAVIIVSPRVPFADAWRHYARLLTQPFVAGVFAADNGHPEVFANLVRYVSLHGLHGDEWIQIVLGLALALASLAVLLRIVWRARDIDASTRAIAIFVLTLSVFWLGNARVLLHDNESLHVYSVLLCFFCAIGLLLGHDRAQSTSVTRVAAATALCFLASFNFGSGVASFAALLALLFVQRAAWSRYAIVIAGLLVTVLCYSVLQGSKAGSLALAPIEQTGVALRWLAAPLIYLFWPFIDPAAAAALPHPFDSVGVVARAWTSVFGDVHRSAIPQVTAGTVLVIALAFASVRARAQRDWINDIARLGVALAWFACGIAGLVALTRSAYFVENPAQLYAPRYLPWSNLAWAGMALIALAKQPLSRTKIVAVAMLGILALGAEGGMIQVMRHQRQDADDSALAAVVGVWPSDDGRSENDPRDTRDGALAMQRVTAGPFAWPEARVVGHELPVDARPVAVGSLDVETATFGLESNGTRLQALIVEAPCDRLLVVDHGLVIGLLRRVQGDRWRGTVSGPVSADSLHVFAAGAPGK